jgi:hypothetical protein
MRAPPPTARKVKNFYIVWSLIDTIHYYYYYYYYYYYCTFYQILPVNLQLTAPEKWLLISSIVIAKQW